MKVIDILKLNKGLLNILQSLGIKVEDVKYIELYNDYQLMIDRGEKVSYIVAILAGRYGVSERMVYMLLKRMQSECNLSAV